MTCIVERCAVNERSYAMKSLYYHWYAAEVDVSADNFVVPQFILMSSGSSASLRLGGSSFINLIRTNLIPNTLSVFGVQHPNGCRENVVRLNRGKTVADNPKWWPLNLKYLYLSLFTR